MKIVSSILVLICLSLSSLSIKAQGFLKAKGQKIVNDKGDNILLRGIGLGGWMLQEGYMLHVNKDAQQHKIKERIKALIGEEKTEAFYDAWLMNNTTRRDIDSLKAWGFNSVRLPMHFNLYTLPVYKEPVPGKNTWLTKGFTLTDSLIAWCKSNHMHVILDLHAAPGGQGNDLNISDRDASLPSLWQSDANKQKTIALWHRLAERYGNDTTVAAYDILNEPNWGFEDTLNDRNGVKEKSNMPLKALLMDITKAIRETDKNHIIIIEGNGWGNNYSGILNDGLWDKNMVLSFHKYWNYNDEKSIAHILRYRDSLNVPVWLGETGENSNVWFADAVHLFESHNIGWSWWPLKKLGINNPLQIKSNPEYDQLTDYWNGKTNTAPLADAAFKGLMQFASDANIQNNIIHYDVIDALIRQPFHFTAIPFKNNSVEHGTIINAVDYDLGRNGIAYYDNDTANYWVSTDNRSAGNSGGYYRNDGVDIYKDSTATNSYYVGKTENGEWLQYTINVTKDDDYALRFLVNGSGSFDVYADDKNIEPIKIPIVNEAAWHSVSAKPFHLSKGTHYVKIYINTGGFNLKSITFK